MALGIDDNVVTRPKIIGGLVGQKIMWLISFDDLDLYLLALRWVESKGYERLMVGKRLPRVLIKSLRMEMSTSESARGLEGRGVG